MAPANDADRSSESSLVTWEISSTEVLTSAREAPESTFATAILMFLDEFETDEWDDRTKFAAIARDYSDLTPEQIAGLLGLQPDYVTKIPPASDPPWTLNDPRGGTASKIRIHSWEE
jgi:hypothetical protein